MFRMSTKEYLTSNNSLEPEKTAYATNFHLTEQSQIMEKENQDLKIKLKQSENNFNEFQKRESRKYQKLFEENENLKRNLRQAENEFKENASSKYENSSTSTANQLEKLTRENLRLKADVDKCRSEQRAEAFKLQRQESAYNDNIMLNKEVDKLTEEVRRQKNEIEKLGKGNKQQKVDATRISELTIRLKGETQLFERSKKDKIKLENDVQLIKEERARDKTQIDNLLKDVYRLRAAVEEEQEKLAIREEKDIGTEGLKREIVKLQMDKEELQEEVNKHRNRIASLNQEIALCREDSKKVKNQLNLQQVDSLGAQKYERANEELKNKIEKLQGELKARYIEDKRKRDDMLKEIGQLKKENEKLVDQVSLRRHDDEQTTQNSLSLREEIDHLRSVIADFSEGKEIEIICEEEEYDEENVQVAKPSSPMNEFLRQMSKD